MESAHRFDYNLPWGGVAFGVVFYSALSVCTAFWASDTTGLFAVLFTSLSAMFVSLAIFMPVQRLKFPRVLELAEDAILFPHGFPRSRITRIPYGDIIRMSESRFRGPATLCLVTGRGMFEIMEIRLPSIESYRAVRDFVCARTSIVFPSIVEAEPS